MDYKYKIIANEIKNNIIDSTYPIGSAIPSESELMIMHSVSRYTIRESVSSLVREGYLEKKRGSGTYVLNYLKKDISDTNKTKKIGVITTYLSDYIFPSIIEGIEKELNNSGYGLLLASTSNNFEQEKICLESMLNQNVDGLIVEPTRSNEYNPNLSLFSLFKKKNIPVVMINAYYETLTLPSICVDDEHSGYLATKYLIEKKIMDLVLIMKIDDLQGKLRMKGFIKAFESSNINFDSKNIFLYKTGEEDSIVNSVIQYICADQKKINGAVCYNDTIGYLLSKGLLEKGIKIPSDISIIAQDNSVLASTGVIKMTSVDHPKQLLGRDAARWIKDSIENNSIGNSIRYAPKIIERLSVQRDCPIIEGDLAPMSRIRTKK